MPKLRRAKTPVTALPDAPLPRGIVDPTWRVPTEFEERRRLESRHDPATPSGCRLCGITLAPKAHWITVGGFKCCDLCRPLIAGLQHCWANIIARGTDERITGEEGEELTVRLGHPAFFVGRWATDPGVDRRWGHLAADIGETAFIALRSIRRAKDPRQRSPTRTGCAWCGVARAPRWRPTPWHFGRNDPRAYACPDCWRWIQSAGVDQGSDIWWQPHLVACCTGMRLAVMGADYGLVPYFETTGREGTAEPWQYLGRLYARLRARVVRDYPSYVTMSDRERRIAVLLAVDTSPPEPPRPLADV